VATTASPVIQTCALARRAALRLAGLESSTKDGALEAIAERLLAQTEEILQANERDMEAGREAGIGQALLDRLRLDEGRVAGLAQGVRQIVALPDPVGETIEGRRLANGLEVRKVRVPIGVIAVVYEARPNVTIDAAALCLKSGNAIVLRGSSIAVHSNAVLAGVASDAALGAGLPRGSVGLVSGGGHEELAELASQSENVDLIIPRGGQGLKAALEEVATVPVIYAASGNCHVYVDASAELDAAEAITLNAKVQRPGVCNAAETLLVHAAAAPVFIPRVVDSLLRAGVALRADERARALAGASASSLAEVSEEDWETEFLDMTIAIGVVDSLEQAIEHIARYGSGHSEAIVTTDVSSARAFQLGVDAACVYVNASTRFTDGGQFGMGAEIGNSTQKLHARGPIGLRELCTYRYLIEGDGHVRA
jgi:glutamate-5-semialdehyde dehydrogenase